MTEQRRLPVRIEHFPLDGAWEGWHFDARASIPMAQYGELLELLAAIGREDHAEMAKAVRGIVAFLRGAVRSWDFVDEQGLPLPVENEESWKQLPMDLVTSMFAAIMGATSQAPLADGAPSSPTSPEPKEESTPSS